jgi:hypothetical protein
MAARTQQIKAKNIRLVFCEHPLPREEARGYYEDLTGNRSASHHLQVKAGIAFLYKVLNKPSPFVNCLAPRLRNVWASTVTHFKSPG